MWGLLGVGLMIGARFPPALPREVDGGDADEVADNDTIVDGVADTADSVGTEDGVPDADLVPDAPDGAGCEEGAACDDGDKCTTEDRCQGGVCVGAPVVCTPASECHLAGLCDRATGLCSSPAKPDGAACDDGNFCTTGDRCGAGICYGPGELDDDDFVVGIEADGGAAVTALASDPQGRATVVLTSRARQMTLTGASNAGLQDTVEERCATRLLRLSRSGSYDSSAILYESDCSTDIPWRVGSMTTPGDRTSVVSGLYDAPFASPQGWQMGASPTGLLVEGGAFVARLKEDGTLLWLLDLIGFSEAHDMDRGPRLSSGPGGALATIVNNGSAGIRQIVDTAGVLVQESVEEAHRSALGLVIGPNGDLRRVIRVESAGRVLGIAAALGQDGTVYLMGMASGEPVVVVDGGHTTTIPAGIHGEYSAWVVGLEGSGEARWWRHFFVPPAAGISSWELQVTPFDLVVLDERVVVTLGAMWLPSVRGDTGPGAPLFETNAPHPSLSMLVELSPLDGAVRRTHKWAGGFVLAVGLAVDALGEIVFGATSGLVEGNSQVGSNEQPALFLTRPGRWAHQASFGDDYFDDDRALRGLHIAPDHSRGVFVAGLIEGPADLGIDARHRVGHRGAGGLGYVMRLGSHGRFDCR